MAGVKGRSGLVSDNLQAHCQAMLRDVAVKKMDTYLQSDAKGPKDASWRWCVETFAKWGGLATVQHEHSGDLTVHLEQARAAFESRVSRLVERLGTAAMPEGTE